MENLTVGQILGIHPLWSKIPTRHQYFSKIHSAEVRLYDEFHDEEEIINVLDYKE